MKLHTPIGLRSIKFGWLYCNGDILFYDADINGTVYAQAMYNAAEKCLRCYVRGADLEPAITYNF